MNAPTETEIAATLFLQDPSIGTLHRLCATGDFGAGSWAFNRSAILKVLREVQHAGDVSISAGRNLSRTRTTRRVFENGRDVSGIYDASLFRTCGRRVTETQHTYTVKIPTFAILLAGPRFEYVFGATFEPLGEGVDLEALHLKIKGP